MTAPEVRAWLDGLDQALDLGTTRPWTADDYGLISGPEAPRNVDHWIASGVFPSDAALIVAAVNALPELVARLRAVLEIVDEWNTTPAEDPGLAAYTAMFRLRAAVTAAQDGAGQ